MLNADVILGQKGKLLSHNAFAYCIGNPINFEDPNGYFFTRLNKFYFDGCCKLFSALLTIRTTIGAYIDTKITNLAKKVLNINTIDKIDDLDDALVSNGASNLLQKGTDAFKKFDINTAYVKTKHLSTTTGNGAKFLGQTKTAAENILKKTMQKGNIVDVIDDGLSAMGNHKYQIILNAGEEVGTKGETFIKIILSDDGGMLSAFPIK